MPVYLSQCQSYKGDHTKQVIWQPLAFRRPSGPWPAGPKQGLCKFGCVKKRLIGGDDDDDDDEADHDEEEDDDEGDHRDEDDVMMHKASASSLEKRDETRLDQTNLD